MAKSVIKAKAPFACGDCGGSEGAPFKGESMVVTVKGGATATVHHLSGVRCTCGEVEFDDVSQARYVAAGDRLVLEDRALVATQLKLARKRLHLTQRQASKIAGGGHNAFSRYERGSAIPVQAVKHLFYLLNLHPELLDELPGIRELLEAEKTSARRLLDCA
jgi:HTH-type transcriptional regulator/antitoxin MqsA